MAFKCGESGGGNWTITRTRSDGTPGGVDEIKINNADQTTGEIDGEVVPGREKVKGRCINSPTDSIILMHPFPGPTHIYIGLTSKDPDNTITGKGTYRITTDAAGSDEGTWTGSKPPA